MIRVILIILCFSSAVFGATYKGVSIDGRKYAASVDTGTVILSCSVSFDGKAVFIYADEYFTGKLLTEDIIDPYDIELTVASEPWSLEILDDLP